MRKAMLTVVALVLAQAPALAQNSDWANKLFSPKAEIVTHNFGSVPRGAQLYHRFKMTNVWAVNIEIMEIRVSCGCVTAKASNRVLEPRQTGYLDVTMDAHRFTGPKTVSIYIKVGPQYVNTATVRVSANSRADVVFNPGQINFGVVPRGQTPAQIIDVEYAGVLDWRVGEVITNSAPVDVQLEELYRRRGQVGYRVRATLKKDAPPGPLKQEMLLKTNDPASPLVPVLVEAIIQAPLSVKPGTVNFGSLQVGQTASKRVIVSGNKPFKILSVEGLENDIQVDLPATAAAVQILNFKFAPAKAGDLKRQLHIKTDLDGQEPVPVTLEATVAPQS